MRLITTSLKERLQKRINIAPSPDGRFQDCWYWNLKDIGKKYYRYIWVGTKDINRKRIVLHRISAHVFNDFDLNSKLCICHKCDNFPCFNPNHLFEGTQTDNIRDMTDKGRRTLGIKNGIPKLEDSKILEIRSKYISGLFSQRELAKQYNVSQTTIRLIIIGKKWKHVK